jgi:hypothetical protein
MRAYVTTSWDDGGALDLKLAERLKEHAVPGTFYWTVDSERFRLPGKDDAQEIVDLGMEVGSHTMTHPDLTAIEGEELRWELAESKERLEDLTGHEVTSFCYPFGYFNRTARDAVQAAGYALGRTTVGFRRDLGSDPFLMPVSIQVYPHGRRVHVAHAVKEANAVGLARWATTYRARTDLLSLTQAALDEVTRTGGVVHLWGHSWELEHNDLWGSFDEVLRLVSGYPGIDFVTNRQLMTAAGGNPPA